MPSSNERFKHIKQIQKPDRIVDAVYRLASRKAYDEAIALGEQHVGTKDPIQRSNLRPALAYCYSLKANTVEGDPEQVIERNQALYSKAAEYLKADLEENPGRLPVMDHLAAVYEDMGEYDKALVLYTDISSVALMIGVQWRIWLIFRMLLVNLKKLRKTHVNC
jgi:tetratricopeptide (TPR) repeat protein